MPARVYVYPDLESLSRAAARDVVGAARAATADHGRFFLALPGGTTPRLLYRLLAQESRAQISWDRVELFWGDERYVAKDHPRSNYRVVKETLLDRVPIPAQQVHPMPTDRADPAEGARLYESELKTIFGDIPRFDLVVLGLASDGHTASLFPGSRALDEVTRWVVAVRAPADPPVRLTLTFPVLNRAAQVFFLVAGLAKAGALHRALLGTTDVQLAPAAGIRPTSGSVTWWVDSTAASMLPPTVRSPLPA